MKVGDRVVCIKAHSMSICPLIVGREYIVYGVQNCCKTTIDIGITNECGTYCTGCYSLLSSGGIWWLNSKLFRKVEEKIEVNYVKLEIEIEEPILN